MRDPKIEAAAKVVYDAMVWAHGQPGTPPAWVEGGNSDAQELARVTAMKIIPEVPKLPKIHPLYETLNGPVYTHVKRGSSYKIVESFRAELDSPLLPNGIVDHQTVVLVERNGNYLLCSAANKPKGSQVKVVATLMVQTSKPVVKDGWWVWYRAVDGTNWLRTPDEFFDGRFTVE